MSDTPEKIETKPFNARIKVEDHKYITNFLKDYEPKHVGFSNLLNRAKSPGQIGGNEIDSQHQTLLNENNNLIAQVEALQLEIKNNPGNKNLEQLFDFSEYSKFASNQDTSILEPIKRGLKAANEIPYKTETPKTASVADFVPKELVDKVNLLQRDLRMKNKIPDSTPSEYLEKLLTHSLKYYLLNEYPNIYNR